MSTTTTPARCGDRGGAAVLDGGSWNVAGQRGAVAGGSWNSDPTGCPRPDLRDEAQTCRAVVDPIGVRLEDLPEPLYRVRCGCCDEATGWWQERRLARAQWVCRWGVAA